MTKTTNYNLNQWDAEDAVRREDFNADNAAIDAALKAISSGSLAVYRFTRAGGNSKTWITVAPPKGKPIALLTASPLGSPMLVAVRGVTPPVYASVGAENYMVRWSDSDVAWANASSTYNNLDGLGISYTTIILSEIE